MKLISLSEVMNSPNKIKLKLIEINVKKIDFLWIKLINIIEAKTIAADENFEKSRNPIPTVKNNE